MSYFLVTNIGLTLKLTKNQALKAISFGKNIYGSERRSGDGFVVWGFYDPDRWVYDIRITEE